MSKVAMPVKGFGGINKLHTRALGQASEGKNFWTRNGALVTREGCSLLSDTPFTTPVRSIHSAAKVQIATRLLVEEEGKLWRWYEGGQWTQLLDNVAGNGFSSVMYYGHLILVNGPQKYAYDVAGDAIAPLQNLEGGEVPAMEFITVHKGILFAWAPNYSDSDTIRFNGYEKDAQGRILARTKDSWPEDFAIKVSGDQGTPVLDCIPAGTHLLVLTQKGYWLLYGEHEDNFSLVPGGTTGVYGARCSAKVGDYAIWLGLDEHGIKRVYAYSGTQPVDVSAPVEELLNTLPWSAFANVWTCGLGHQFWLLLPDAQGLSTKAFVFDTREKQWYVHEFPAAFTCGCLHGEYMDRQYVYFGTRDAKVVRLDESNTDFGHKIVTEFKIGPIHLEDARKFKAKRLWLNAEPRTDFSLNVYASSDAGDESGPYVITFTAGGQKTQQVKLQGGNKGRDVYLRVTTTDRVDELQSFSLTMMPKQVK